MPVRRHPTIEYVRLQFSVGPNGCNPAPIRISHPTGELSASGRSAQAEDRQEGFVDAPELLAAAMTCEFAEPLRVDGADLFDKYPGALTIHLDD